MQNTGAGIHAGISEFCDGVNDGAWRLARFPRILLLLLLGARFVSARPRDKGHAQPPTPSTSQAIPHRAGAHFLPSLVLAGVCVVRWPTEKNKDQASMCCIVTVFGVAYFM
jgi:hypothetical protein